MTKDETEVNAKREDNVEMERERRKRDEKR